MLKILQEIESNLTSLIQDALINNTLKTKYIDYHDPYVSRIYFPYGKYRVFLHKDFLYYVFSRKKIKREERLNNLLK